MDHTKNDIRIDLVWGAAAIAIVLGAKRRQTFHLLETGQIPAKKVGGRWVAERGKLHAFFLDEDAG